MKEKIMKIHVLGSNGYIAKRFLEHLDRKEVLTYSRYKKYSDVVFDIEKYDEFNYDNFKIGDYVIFWLRFLHLMNVIKL